MRQRHSFRLSFIIGFFIVSSSLQAQRFDSLLNILETKYPQEKMYLQFDRAIYNPGETIWFKAYIFTANYPSPISKTVYVELLDEKGKLLQRKTTQVVMSGAASSFDLPANIQSSVVYVRAYTRWMLNFDSSFLFTKAIPIASLKQVAGKKLVAATFLQFFPEGGDLVQSLESTVAFKATDRKGLPVEVSGDILNSKGKKILSFASVHDGMGSFVLQPDSAEKYKAVWKERNGVKQETSLPQVKKSGVVLKALLQTKGIQFVVRRTADESTPFSSVYIVAHDQQQLLYRARADMSNTTIVSGLIPTENIPSGIIQLTVFTRDEKPLAERVIFINNDDSYFITDLNAPLKKLDKRAKNVLQIDVPDTLKCNLSIAVTDAEINPLQEGEDNIYSHLFLTGDLKGYIHHPSYYFSSEADSVKAHLDLVMLTNGWRRFKWEDVLAGNWPTLRNTPEGSMAIVGNVTGLPKSKLVQKDLTLIFETKNGNSQFMNVPLDPDGRFFIPDMIFYDSARLFYQFNNDKNKVLTSSAVFNIKNNLLNEALQLQPDSSWLLRLNLPDSATLKKNLQVSRKNQIKLEEEQKKVQTLATVEVVGKQKSTKEKLDDEYTSGLFKGGDGYTFVTEDDPFAKSALTVLDYLQGKVPGLQISMNGGRASLSWRGGEPSLYMNEMPGDAEMIQSLPMTDVALIKVFRPPFFGSFGGGSGGAIAVYTKKGGSEKKDFKGLDFAKIPGYSPIKEYYSPDYSRYDQSNSEEDLRSTLYWNPFILTNKHNRRVILSFYNNDLTKKLRVVIEGINEEGKLTRIEKFFE